MPVPPVDPSFVVFDVHGADRSALARFQHLPVPQVEPALDAILDDVPTLVRAWRLAAQ
ncbi:hypothetical protein AB0B74_02280 [Micromonospora parva]|uniref:hypothetical protein n=1 Tax=Micromonospora parva TaxID=1464048 RepID=UPI0033DCEA9B